MMAISPYSYLCYLSDDDVQQALFDACSKGELPLVQYALTSPELKKAGLSYALIDCQDGEPFVLACSWGHLEIVKYLLHSPEIMAAGGKNFSLQGNEQEPLLWASWKGHLNVVQFLIETIAQYASEDVLADLVKQSFKSACINGHLSIARFIASHPTLHQHIPTCIDDNEYFTRVCDNSHLAMAKFLVFDARIDLTSPVEAYISDKPDVKKMFDSRMLKEKLDQQLTCQPQHKKPRI